MVHPSRWNDRVLLKSIRLRLRILLWICIALIAYLQHDRIFRIISYLIN